MHRVVYSNKVILLHVAIAFYCSRTYFSAYEISTVTYRQKKQNASFMCLFFHSLVKQ